MARRPTASTELMTSLSNMKANQVAALARVGSLETTSPEFGKVFRENPAAALAAKGIVLDEAMATKLKNDVAGLANSRAADAAGETEVTVSVGVKF